MKNALLISASVFVILLSVSCDKALFGTPENLGEPINTESYDSSPYISPDGLELYFCSDRSGNGDIWICRRGDTQESWGNPEDLGKPVNSNFWDFSPWLTPDGLELYFASGRPEGTGGYDLWVCTRETLQDSWGPPENLGIGINTIRNEVSPCLSADGKELYFSDFRTQYFRDGGIGGGDLWVSRREYVGASWGKPTNLGTGINSPFTDYYPQLEGGDLLLFFISNRPEGYGQLDIWVSARPRIDEPWGPPINLGPGINTERDEHRVYITPDIRNIYFGSDRPGSFGETDIWKAEILSPEKFINTLSNRR
jgi:Tol biopolymer transport system component